MKFSTPMLPVIMMLPMFRMVMMEIVIVSNPNCAPLGAKKEN